MTKSDRVAKWDAIQAEETRKAQEARGKAAAARADGKDGTADQEAADRHQQAADNAAAEAAAIRQERH